MLEKLESTIARDRGAVGCTILCEIFCHACPFTAEVRRFADVCGHPGGLSRRGALIAEIMAKMQIATPRRTSKTDAAAHHGGSRVAGRQPGLLSNGNMAERRESSSPGVPQSRHRAAETSAASGGVT